MQTISESAKRRLPASYHPREGKILDKSTGADFFKEIVEKEPIGRNKKGKTIFSSRTRHVRA